MSISPKSTSTQTNDISLSELWEVIFSRRWLICFISLSFAAIAATYAFLATPYYRAEAVLAAVSSGDESGLANLANRFAGVGGLLGGMQVSSGQRKSEALATLQSRALTEAYIKEKNLLPVLFASKWDQQQQMWRSTNPRRHPTLWDGNKLFNQIRSVEEDRKTGLIRLTIEWRDAQTASQWTEDFIERTNSVLRLRAIDKAEANIKFLNEQLQQTQVIEIRQAIYKVLEGEIKNVMLARGDDEYALKIIDPPVMPQDKVRPKRALICIAGLIVGMIFAILFALTARKKK